MARTMELEMAAKTVGNNAVEGKLSGRVAIVTGAGSGIGQGIAIALAKEGVRLIIVGRTQETLNKTVDLITPIGTTVHCVQGSVTERDTANRAVSEAVSRFGRLDTLVNNAHTFAPLFSVEETPEADFRTHMESGFYGTLYFMQAAFPHMRERGGSIVNFGSIAGLQGSGEIRALRCIQGSYSRTFAYRVTGLGKVQDPGERRLYHRRIRRSRTSI